MENNCATSKPSNNLHLSTYALAILVSERRHRSRAQIGFLCESGVRYGSRRPLLGKLDALPVGLVTSVSLRGDKFFRHHCVEDILAHAGHLPELMFRPIDGKAVLIKALLGDVLSGSTEILQKFRWGLFMRVVRPGC